MNDELQTDDEVLRERAMTDGPKRIAGLNMRPMTPLTLSILRRHKMIGFDKEELQMSSAYGFVHSAPIDEVRAVANDTEKFLYAVDAWLDRNFSIHHDDLEPLAGMMAEAFETYMAAKSTGSGPYQGNGSKN